MIEREELDITKVSLAQITDQYLEYIGRLEETKVANLVDFLVVASKLLLIKSRLLLPASPSIVDEKEEDIGEELVRQLVEYKKFKELAAYLSDREKQHLHAYVRVGTPTVAGSQKTLNMNGVSIDSLIEAVRSALALVPSEPPVSQVIPPIVVSLHTKISQMRMALQQRGEMSFQEFVANLRSRMEIIVSFLAMLELIKGGRLSVHQERPFGEIVMRYRPDGQKAIEETVQPGEALE